MYEVQCSECEEVYVGETGRTLKKRISEHKQSRDMTRDVALQYM